jgi:hypothetical protein
MKKMLWSVPLVGVVLYNLWVLWLESENLLPDPLATHWGVDGVADGFSDVAGHLVWANFALLIFSALIVWVEVQRKIHKSVQRLLVAIIGYFTLFIFGLMISVVWIQIGLSDASQVRFGAEVIWFLLPVLALIPLMLSMPKVVIGRDFQVRLWGITFLKLSFGEITSVSERFIRPSDFGGWGLRMGRDSVAFIPSKGPALEILTSSGQVILVRSNQVENLIAAVRARI